MGFIFKILGCSATMNDIDSNFYRNHNNDTRVKKSKQRTAEQHHFTHSHEKLGVREEDNDAIELKEENAKLKRMLKEAQAKRSHITKQCSEVVKKLEMMEEQNLRLTRRLKDDHNSQEGSQVRLDELRFLNKQLNNEIEQLRRDNEKLNEKIRYHTEVLERKYEDIEERTFKRIEQAIKRIKKGVHYLVTLNPREIEKTKEIQVDNLKKTVDILRGKFAEDKYEQEIEELMNPIRNIQQDLHQKSKQNNLLKEENSRLQHELNKHKKIENELMPQYKESIEKLKKGLAQMRGQLSENQYEKCQLKKKYQEKLKELEIKYDDLFKDHRKIKLENKIYEKKLEEMEADVEEEKERLMEENELLKKLYKSEDEDVVDTRTEGVSYKTSGHFKRRDYTDAEGEPVSSYDRGLKKNYSTTNLRNSTGRLSSGDNSRSRLKLDKSRRKNYEHLRHGKDEQHKLEISDYYQNTGEDHETSQFSQESLKNQIFKIDQEIMDIQRTLNQELQIYK